jgi:hypothetical protein
MASKRTDYDDQWLKLWRLILNYGNACRADEMKGGGDPLDIPIIEMELKLARDKLGLQYDRMREDK